MEPEYVDYSGDFITDKRWPTRKEMIEWAQSVGRKRNTTIVIMKSWKATKTTGEKVLLSCEKSGKPRSGKRVPVIGEVKTWISRKGNTKKTDCPFVLEGEEISPSTWRLSIRCGRHNHELPPGLQGHAYEGRLTPKQYEEVQQLSKAGARPTAVLQKLRDAPEPNYTTRKQIYNAKAKQRLEARGAMTPIQYMFSMMAAKNYSFNYRASPNPEDDWIQDLVYAHPKSLGLWEIFPYVMIIDATYQTNRYYRFDLVFKFLSILVYTCLQCCSQ